MRALWCLPLLCVVACVKQGPDEVWIKPDAGKKVDKPPKDAGGNGQAATLDLIRRDLTIEIKSVNLSDDVWVYLRITNTSKTEVYHLIPGGGVRLYDGTGIPYEGRNQQKETWGPGKSDVMFFIFPRTFPNRAFSKLVIPANRFQSQRDGRRGEGEWDLPIPPGVIRDAK